MRKSLGPAVFLFFLGMAVAADVVTLRNGDRVSGTIVRGDLTSMVVKTVFMGEVTIARDAVTGITSDQLVYLELSDGQTLFGAVRTEDAGLKVDTSQAGTVSVDLKNVRSIRSQAEEAAVRAEVERYRNPGLLDLWSGSVDLGFSLTSGNSRNMNFALGGNAVRETKRDKISVYVASVYARSEVAGVTSTTANAVRGGGRYEIMLGDRLNVFGFGDLEHDVFQQLDLRLVLGGGLGYYVIKSEHTRLQVFGGGNMNREYFTDGLRRNTGEAMFGQSLSTRLFDKLTFVESLSVFPNLSERGEYRIAFDSSASMALKKWLAWHLTFSDRYLTDPAPGAKSNDILLTTGLRFTFRK